MDCINIIYREIKQKSCHTFAESTGDGSVPHLRGLESGELLDLIRSQALTWVGTGMGSDWLLDCMGSEDGLLGLDTSPESFLYATEPTWGSTLTT